MKTDVNFDAYALRIGGVEVIRSDRVLKNIASVAQSLTPDADGTRDFGSSSLYWATGFLNQLKLKELTADPSGLEGLVAFRNDLKKLRAYINAAWRNVWPPDWADIQGKVIPAYSGGQVFNGNAPTAWTDLDLSSVVGARRALVFLKVVNNYTVSVSYYFRADGETANMLTGYDSYQSSDCCVGAGMMGTCWVWTSSSGVIEWYCFAGSFPTQLFVLAYIPLS